MFIIPVFLAVQSGGGGGEFASVEDFEWSQCSFLRFSFFAGFL